MKSLRLMTKIKLTAASMMLAAVSGVWFYCQHNIDWAARVAWGEARGEPEGGMHAVLNVMMNRKGDPRFPSSLSGVVRQPHQFSSLNRGNPNKHKLETVPEDDPAFRRAKRLATFAQLGLLWDITDGATHYHSNKIDPPAYLQEARAVKVIGNHLFYKGVD